MENKKQVLIIKGGQTFENKEDFYNYLRNIELDPFNKYQSWVDNITTDLGESYEVIIPLMPNKQSADYEAWKIWFERYLKFIKDKAIIIGFSLGATFILKYLSENDLPKKISQLHLVSTCVVDEISYFSEKLNTFEFDISKIERIKNMCSDIHIWHSMDDNIVPILNGELVYKYLPNANFHKFMDRGHFNQPAFIEILQVINKK